MASAVADLMLAIRVAIEPVRTLWAKRDHWRRTGKERAAALVTARAFGKRRGKFNLVPVGVQDDCARRVERMKETSTVCESHVDRCLNVPDVEAKSDGLRHLITCGAELHHGVTKSARPMQRAGLVLHGCHEKTE